MTSDFPYQRIKKEKKKKKKAASTAMLGRKRIVAVSALQRFKMGQDWKRGAAWTR